MARYLLTPAFAGLAAPSAPAMAPAATRAAAAAERRRTDTAVMAFSLAGRRPRGRPSPARSDKPSPRGHFFQKALLRLIGHPGCAPDAASRHSAAPRESRTRPPAPRHTA